MSAYTPSQIETMALTFTRRQAEALSALKLPFTTDGEMFEAMLDQVADKLKVCEAGWDLFASTARLTFYGINDVPAVDRRRWAHVADAARDALYAAAREDAKLQAADHHHDLRREVAA